MLKGRTGELLIPLLLLLFSITLLLLGEFYWEYRPSVIMFPWMAGGLVIISSVWLLIRALAVPVETLSREGESLGVSEDPRASLIKRLGWMAAVYPLCYVLGMIAGLLVFTLAYTSYHRLPWWQRLIAATVVFCIVYIGFYTLLGVSLPINPLWMRE